MIVEEIFTMATHKSVNGYRYEDGWVVPTFVERNMTDRERKIADLMHKTYIDYANEIAQTANIKEYVELFKAVAAEAVEMFLRQPDGAEVKAISDISVMSHQAHEKEKESYVASELGIKDLVDQCMHEIKKVMPKNRRKKFVARYTWRHGSASISPTHVRMGYYLLRSVMNMSLKTMRLCRLL
jgi:hypothetical protein